MITTVRLLNSMLFNDGLLYGKDSAIYFICVVSNSHINPLGAVIPTLRSKRDGGPGRQSDSSPKKLLGADIPSKKESCTWI